MPSYHARALVLRKTKLGETDLILTLLASDGRQIRAVAKGARATKSRFGARVEPFSLVDLLIHSGRSLDVITEAQTVASHDRLRSDLDRAEAAAVVVDVLDKVSLEGQSEPRMYEMALATLDAMETAPQDSLALLVIAFLLKALAMHGYRPALAECAACARSTTGAALFSPRTGGCLCGECEHEDPAAVPLDHDEHALMRALMRARMSEIAALETAGDLPARVLRLVAAYVAYHVPARLKALDSYVRGR